MKYFLVALGVVFSVIAQVLIKNASFYDFWGKKWIIFMLLSVSSYGLAFLLQSYLMKLFPLSKIAPAMAIAIMILVFIAGVVFFKETIQLKQAIGILLGIVSIYLILS